MSKRIARIVFAILGIAIGLSIADFIVTRNFFDSIPPETQSWLSICVYSVLAIAFGCVGFFITPYLIKLYRLITKKLLKTFTEMPIAEAFLGIIGLIVGLVIAWLISSLTRMIKPEILGTICSVAVFLVCGYIGWKVPTKRIKEINIPKWFKRGDKNSDKSEAMAKVLDTSAFVDGRFYDVMKTGIVEGSIIVPKFIIDELWRISDSSDALKRTRGKRGLDILEKMQEEMQIEISEDDYPDIADADAKLIKFALDHHAMIVTTDYNLNKVCSVQSIPVFNVNDLSNALKISVAAGEELVLTIVKEGKELNQGVAYFDDGTMIVVDGARSLIGQQVSAVVTSVLQTSAGRMVFAKLKE